MMYGLRKIKKILPHDTNETKSRILIPMYRFVTSANFLIGIIAIAILFILIFLPVPFMDASNDIGTFETLIPIESMTLADPEVIPV